MALNRASRKGAENGSRKYRPIDSAIRALITTPHGLRARKQSHTLRLPIFRGSIEIYVAEDLGGPRGLSRCVTRWLLSSRVVKGPDYAGTYLSAREQRFSCDLGGGMEDVNLLRSFFGLERSFSKRRGVAWLSERDCACFGV